MSQACHEKADGNLVKLINGQDIMLRRDCIERHIASYILTRGHTDEETKRQSVARYKEMNA